MKTILLEGSASFTKLILMSILLVASVQAEEKTGIPGYLQDADGSVVRTKTNCVRTSAWTRETALTEGCDGVVLALTDPGVIMFAFDSAELTSDGKAVIDKHRGTLKPKLTGAYSGVVIGHADNRGNSDYNVWLSRQRAISVRDYLVGEGAEARKISIVGRGSDDPIASNNTFEGRKLNRRVDIVIIEESEATK